MCPLYNICVYIHHIHGHVSVEMMEIRRSCSKNLRYWFWPHELESPVFLNAWSLFASLFLLEHETAGFWLIPIVSCCTFGEHTRAAPLQYGRSLLIHGCLPSECVSNYQQFKSKIPTYPDILWPLSLVLFQTSHYQLERRFNSMSYCCLDERINGIPLSGEDIPTALWEW